MFDNVFNTPLMLGTVYDLLLSQGDANFSTSLSIFSIQPGFAAG